jgi:hypothetical protein
MIRARQRRCQITLVQFSSDQALVGPQMSMSAAGRRGAFGGIEPFVR